MKREMLILSVPFIFLGAFSQAQEEFPRTPSGRPISAVTMIFRHLLRLRTTSFGSSSL